MFYKNSKKNDLSKRYFGEKATFYDKKRESQKKWKEEQKVVEKVLSQVYEENEKGLSVLDIPVGTGRFFEFYKNFNFSVTGADISEDMIKEAQEKAKKINLQSNFKIEDITNINFSNNEHDLIVCIRIFNLINFEKFAKSLAEITRVSRKYVVFGIRLYPPSSKIFSENSTFDSIKILIQKTKRNIRMSVKKNYFIHPEGKVLTKIKENNLNIVEKITVETKGGHWYYIFLLKK